MNNIQQLNSDVSAENGTKPHVGGWVSFAKGFPDENETVWLYNRMNKFVALGCHVWTGEDGGWCWALSNGTIYGENGKIVSECENIYFVVNYKELKFNRIDFNI